MRAMRGIGRWMGRRGGGAAAQAVERVSRARPGRWCGQEGTHASAQKFGLADPPLTPRLCSLVAVSRGFHTCGSESTGLPPRNHHKHTEWGSPPPTRPCCSLPLRLAAKCTAPLSAACPAWWWWLRPTKTASPSPPRPTPQLQQVPSPPDTSPSASVWLFAE